MIAFLVHNVDMRVSKRAINESQTEYELHMTVLPIERTSKGVPGRTGSCSALKFKSFPSTVDASITNWSALCIEQVLHIAPVI